MLVSADALINRDLAKHTKGISLNCGFRWLRKVSKMLCMKMLDLVNGKGNWISSKISVICATAGINTE